MKRPMLKYMILLVSLMVIGNKSNGQQTPAEPQVAILPALTVQNSNDVRKELVFHMALGDIYANIRPYKNGLLKEKKLSFMAGINYNKPWTRDASINTWNGGGLLFPQVAKHTLLATLVHDSTGKVIIGGQYWDKMIWAVGAWNYYLYSGDKEMLKRAFDISKRTITQLEDEEFDADKNLFRGPAVYGDGVAAYPKIYTQSVDDSTYSGIKFWPQENPDLRADKGFGVPMHALSTNCLYYHVYNILTRMANELGESPNAEWTTKAENLKAAINKNFWNEKRKTYDYLVGPFGGSDAQEGMGISFAIMFDVADSDQTAAIFKHTHVEPAGLPVVWPSFPRYVNKEKTSYGRHSGTIWPHVEGFWAYAAALNDRTDIFQYEYDALTENAWNDKQFSEIYHPKTGKKYGGIQENGSGRWNLTHSQNRQTWSATAYLRMVLMGVVGMRFDTDGITFKPIVPEQMGGVHLENIRYRDALLDITINGTGDHIASATVNGKQSDPFIPANATGDQSITINLGS